jgi:hypothetical protein
MKIFDKFQNLNVQINPNRPANNPDVESTVRIDENKTSFDEMNFLFPTFLRHYTFLNNSKNVLSTVKSYSTEPP